MNKVLQIIALIAIVAGLGYAGYSLFQKDKKEETEIIKADANKNAKKKKKDSALPVKAMKIQRGDLPLRLNISATADVWEKAVVKSEAAGTVESIKFTVGDWVRKSQLMVKLDDVEKRLAVDQREADKLKTYSNYLVKESTEESSEYQTNNKLSDTDKAKLAQLKTDYLKAVNDFDKGKISRTKFDSLSEQYQKALIFSGQKRDDIRKAQEGFAGAAIELRRAQLDLDRTSIRSPFQGVVSELKVSKGQKISAGVELFKVVNLKTLYLRGFALESEISKLKEGTKVRVRFDAFPKEPVYGVLESISPEIDPERKTINIYIKVDNHEKRFLPGMHAEIDLEHEVVKNVMKVPLSAVIPRQDRYLVFIVKELKGTTGVAYWEYVTLGNKNDEEIEIKSDVIKEGDLVLIDGHYTLAHQSRVKISK